MEQMTRMNSHVVEIQDFIKMNIQPKTNKKGKQVSLSDQLLPQAIANPMNQGASSSQTQNLNHVHGNKEAMEIVTNQDHKVIENTWSRVKKITKLTNFIK